jgi:Spy/CpxP family protein refolding chaperone
MKSIRFRLLVAALAVLLGSAIAKSQTAADAPPPPPMHGHEFGMHGEMMGFFAKQLNLTDDQKAQMKAVMQKQHPVMKPLFEQQHQIDVQLRQYVEGTFDQTKVQALATQKAQVEAQITVQQTRIHNQLYQMLTADQQTKVKELEAQHEARMQQHMQQEPPAPPEE